MPRPSSSKDGGGGGGGGGLFGAIRPGSRRSSKVPSEDGHSVAAGANSNVLRAPSISAQSSDHHRALDRHTRMKLAMAEAQAEMLGGVTVGNGTAASASADGRANGAHAQDIEHDTHTPSGAVSPRTNIAAGQAQAQAAAAVAAAQRMAATSPSTQAQAQASQPPTHQPLAQPGPTDKPGEGSLTFEAFGGASGGDVVLADGVTPPSAGAHTATVNIADPNATDASAAAAASSSPPTIPSTVTDSPTAVRQQSLPPDDHSAGPAPQHARYATTANAAPSSMQRQNSNQRTASLAVQGEPPGGAAGAAHTRSRTDHHHTMAQSASTSALTPGPFSRLRKLSDASSHGGALSVDGRPSEHAQHHQQSRKSSKGGASGGIAAALAASGAGMAGLGAANPAALQEAHAKAAAAAAAVAAASPQTRKSSHGQRVEKDFVGGSQGGVYRDPRSGLLVEKNEAGEEVLVSARLQSQLDPDRTNSAPPPGTAENHSMLAPVDPLQHLRHHPSTSSLAESDASSASGLAAAASFPAAMQAGSLLTPALSHTANAPGPPTIALDASHAEHHYPSPRASLENKDATAADGTVDLDAARRHSGDFVDSASTAGGAGSGAGAGWADMGAQITGFAVASSKRNAEFHALFPNVPDDDYLIEDYGCALVREVFIQGRLYVSENHVCFNANIFGWVTNIVVPFSEIVAIEKRMTALIIPNAIQIATLHVKHTFSSFLSRDTTYDIMANIWKLSHPDVPLSGSGTGVGIEGGEDDDDESEDGDGASHDATASTTTPSKVSKRSRLRKKFGKSKDEYGGQRVNGGVVVNGKSVGGGAGAAGASGAAVNGNGPGAGGDAATTATATATVAKPKKVIHRATSCPCETTKDKKHYATTVMDAKYPAVPSKVYDVLFKSDFMRDFWTDNQKLLDLDVGPWKPGSDGVSVREFSYIKPLSGSIGPKQTKCLCSDEAQHVDADAYMTAVTTTRTPDVPSGGSFSVKTRVCITWAGGGNFSKVLVTCATEWTGRSMLKGVIDKASIDGQKVYYRDLEEAMRKHIADNPALFKEEGDDDDDDDEGGEGEGGEAAAEAAGAAAGAAAAGAAGDASSDKKDSTAGGSASSSSTAAAAADGPSSLLDRVLDLGSAALGALTSSPSSALLAAVVALLVLSNIWALSSSGAARGQARDPLDPHRLRGSAHAPAASASKGARRQQQQPHAQTHTQTQDHAVAEVVRDVLKDYLEPLSAGLAALSQPADAYGHGHRHGRGHARRGMPAQVDVQSVEAAREEMAHIEEAMLELQARMDALRRGFEALGAEEEARQGKRAVLEGGAGEGQSARTEF